MLILASPPFGPGGPGTRVSLCPKSTFKLFGPIFFTSKDQELSTQGYPTDATRAKLVCAGETITAVQSVPLFTPALLFMP